MYKLNDNETVFIEYIICPSKVGVVAVLHYITGLLELRILPMWVMNDVGRECKPGGYFLNPGLRVWRPSNPGTRVPGFDVGL